MASFSQLAPDTQKQISRTTAEMTRLGISADITAHNLDIGTKVLGQGATKALEIQRAIANEAIKLGVAPAKMAEEFTAAIPKLAQYGQASVQIFKELATQAKATGLSVQDLIGITQQFDTFEGASQAAGKLNAMLGGNLVNSVDLLSQTESQRVVTLRQLFQEQNRSWKDMDKFQQMSIAHTAGINDIAKAARLFGTSNAEFAKTQQSANALAMTEKEMAKVTAEATSAGDKFKLMFESLSIAALPLLKALNWVLDVILKVSDKIGPLWTLFLFVGVPAIGALVVGWSTLTAAMSIAIGVAAAFGITLSAAIWPITLTVAAVALLVAGFAALAIYWDDWFGDGSAVATIEHNDITQAALPAHAGGVEDFSGGMALVGEQGPEIVSLPAGSDITPNNELSNKLASSGSDKFFAQSTASSEKDQKMERLERIIEKQTMERSTERSAGTNQPVILQLDGRELGKVIVNLLDQRMKVNLVGA